MRSKTNEQAKILRMKYILVPIYAEKEEAASLVILHTPHRVCAERAVRPKNRRSRQKEERNDDDDEEGGGEEEE